MDSICGVCVYVALLLYKQNLPRTSDALIASKSLRRKLDLSPSLPSLRCGETKQWVAPWCPNMFGTMGPNWCRHLGSTNMSFIRGHII